LNLNSLSLKLLLAYVGGMLASLTLLVIAAVIALRSQTLGRMDLAGLAEDMATKVAFDDQGRPFELHADEEEFLWVFDSLQREAAYRVVDEDGKVAFVSSAGESFWPAADARSLSTQRRFEFQSGGVAMYGATEPVEHLRKTWYLQVAVSRRLMTLLHRVALPLVGAGIIAFGLVLLIAFGFSAYATLRYTLKPLRDLSDSAAAISPRSLPARLPTEAVPSEIVPLVVSFNRVLERLDHGYRMQQDFLSTAAHELKTPLTLIRAQVEFMEAGELRSALMSDLVHMTRQVHQLLHLAEASEVRGYRFSSIDVAEVAQEAADYLRPIAGAAGVDIVVPDRSSCTPWRADRGALFTLLKNLLENAIEHSPPGTEVRVEATDETITVRDWGPGVSEEQLPQMFTRFWRGAHRRDHGAGLGLSICQEVALAHGWVLSAERAEPGLRLSVSRAGGWKASPP
jgi:signal transduction histidine kinase